MSKTYIVLIACYSFFSCHLSGQLNKDRPFGQAILLTSNSNETYNAELVALTDSSILIYAQEKYTEINNQNIKKLFLKDYYNPGKKYIIGAALLAIETLAVVGAGSGSSAQAAIHSYACETLFLFIPLTIYSYFIDAPQTTFTFPLNEEDASEVMKHCRYPLGLSDIQLTQLRTEHPGD